MQEEQGALSQIVTSEIEQQISTARKYPRDMRLAAQRIEDIATMDEDTAMACFYHLQRSGKPIIGPSVRLAEIAVGQWGNLRAGARIIEEGQRSVIAQGVFHDLETNVAITVEVRRSIWGKRGRYSDDMITVACNAACAIAYRNVVFKGIPAAIVSKAFEAARKVAIGDATTVTDRTTKMIAAFAGIGVNQEELLAYLGCGSVSDITPDHVADMLGTFTAIRDGDTSVGAVFRGETNAAQEGVDLSSVGGDSNG